MRLKFNHEQLALLREINAPYIPGRDYNEDALSDLEDYISDYVLGHCPQDELNIRGTKGCLLLDLLSLIGNSVSEYLITPELA
jgi:hypothetical protein